MNVLSRVAAKCAALSLVLAALAAQTPQELSAPEGAGLLRHGPIDPANGYPKWFQDRAPAQGQKSVVLQLLNNVPGVIDPPAVGQPVSFPTNWPGESFYYMAMSNNASATGSSAAFESALEATFQSGAPVAGEQIIFSRIRIRITGLQDGGTYFLRHPYGTEVEVAAAGGINMTRDIGIGAPGDFSGALHGDTGPFLVPANMPDSQLVAGASLGDGATLTRVRRGLNGINHFEIEGPGIEAAFPEAAAADGALNNNKVRFLDFTILGRIASQLGASIDKAYYQRDLDPALNNAAHTYVNVWSSSASAQNLVVGLNIGTVASPTWTNDIQMTENADSGSYFARLDLGTVAPPSQVRVRNLSDNPTTEIVSLGQKVSDLVIVDSAVFTPGVGMTINARSSDKVEPPAPIVQTASAQQTLQVASSLVGGATGKFAGTITMTSYSAPTFVEVSSPLGDRTLASVELAGLGTAINAPGAPTGPVVEPLVANAGPDQTVESGRTVQLNGAASQGPAGGFTFQWSAPVGITLDNATIASPRFTSQVVFGAPSVLTFSLTVSDGVTTSTDQVVVTLSPQVARFDATTILDARYDIQRSKWRASGTSSVLANQVVKIYLGSATTPDLTRLIGEAVVDAAGNWQFQGSNGSAATNTRVTAAGLVGGIAFPRVYAVSQYVGNQANQSGSFVYQAK